MKRATVVALAFLLGSFCARASAGEVTLASLKNGAQFEVVDAVSVPVPAALTLLGQIPTLQTQEGHFGLARSEASPGPSCLISGLILEPGFPDKLSLSKGSKITVGSVKIDKKPSTGTSVSFVARSSETSLKPRIQCFAGKAAKGAMPIETFEKLFRHKVRLVVGG